MDNFDGDISQLVEVDIIEGDLRNPGIHKINYTVVDSPGNKLEYIRKINILKLYKIGETIEIGQYTLQFLSYYYSDIDTEPQTGYYSYYTADDGQTFVIFKLKVYNNGKEASEPFDIWNKDSLNLDLVIGDGYTYEDTAHSLENNWYYYYVSLRSQQSKTLNLTFEIPDSKANNSEQKIIKINADTISDTKYLILD